VSWAPRSSNASKRSTTASAGTQHSGCSHLTNTRSFSTLRRTRKSPARTSNQEVSSEPGEVPPPRCATHAVAKPSRRGTARSRSARPASGPSHASTPAATVRSVGPARRNTRLVSRRARSAARRRSSRHALALAPSAVPADRAGCARKSDALVAGAKHDPQPRRRDYASAAPARESSKSVGAAELSSMKMPTHTATNVHHFCAMPRLPVASPARRYTASRAQAHPTVARTAAV
jgi:hypothetical protein